MRIIDGNLDKTPCHAGDPAPRLADLIKNRINIGLHHLAKDSNTPTATTTHNER